MNRSILVYIIGVVLKIEAAILLLPTLVGVIYREPQYKYYLLTAVVCFLIGSVLSYKKPSNTTFYLKEGCVTTVLSWVVLSGVGGIPLYVSGDIPNFLNAIFESVSGFTTTGSTILTDIEVLSHASLFWRSFTHWIGGLGVLVFLLALIPMTGGSNLNLLKTESTGPSVGKLAPKIRQSARILYSIYIVLTLLDIIFLIIGKVEIFDALCTAFGTTGTGGFSIHNDSIYGFTPFAKWVTIVFMVLASLNFNIYYLLVLRQFKKIFDMDEFRVYIGIITVAIAIIIIDISSKTVTAVSSFTDVAFQVTSIISSTGFSTQNFDQWPNLSRTILMLLAVIGSCAGSTGGGFKVTRLIILLKTFKREMHLYLHPKSIKTIKMNGEILEEEVIRSTGVYFVVYIAIMVISILIISIEERDLVTNFTAVIATLNNTGPGLSMVNASANFAFFHPLSKIVFIFDMLAGRLELFPMLILFHPATINELLTFKKKKKEHHENIHRKH